MEFKKSYVYAYHVTSHGLIKVGFGDNPKSRMLSYCSTYGISADTKSLKSWDFPAASIASVIETAIHDALIESGFERHSLLMEDQEAQELFVLGSSTYQDALEIVTEAIEKSTRSLMTGLRTKERLVATEKENLRREEIRKQKAEEKRRSNLYKEQVEAVLRQRMTERARATWASEVQPWLDCVEKAKQLMQQKSHFSGIANLWTGRDSVDQLRYRAIYPAILDLVSTAFHGMRRARAWRLKLVLEFGSSVYPEGVDLQFPGGCYLPEDTLHDSINEYCVTEVRLAVQSVTGWGGDDALTLMKRDPDAFRELIQFARDTPSIERQTGRTWARYTTLGKYTKPDF